MKFNNKETRKPKFDLFSKKEKVNINLMIII